MAKTTVEKTVVVNLVLTLEEANWLMEAMQNPLYGELPEHEEPISRTMRISLFTELKGALANG